MNWADVHPASELRATVGIDLTARHFCTMAALTVAAMNAEPALVR